MKLQTRWPSRSIGREGGERPKWSERSRYWQTGTGSGCEAETARHTDVSPFLSHGKIPTMNCSVVIPVYRGEATLIPLVERLAKVLPAISDSYEAVLVNDGSPDNSWAVIEGLAKQYSWVRGIDLMRNYGQHN